MSEGRHCRLASIARRSSGIALALGALLAASTAGATILSQHYEFVEPAVEIVDGVCSVSMENAWSFGAPGEPVLPKAGVQILLPPGEVITNIEVIPGEKVTLDGSYLVEVGQPQCPLSFVGPPEAVQPSQAIYGSGSAFPGKLHDEPQTGLFRGYRIASFALHPVEYIPLEGRLSYVRSMEVRLTTSPSADAMAETARMIRHDVTTLSRVSKIVDNPHDLGIYDSVERVHTGTRTLDPELAYKYVIITTDAWDDYLDPLVAFATQRGHKAGVFLKSWILENYTQGVDDQDDIRDFIIDAYDTWDIDYVLLVGDSRDDNDIPHRGLYSTAYGSTDLDIPADLYYACLDGNWNNDGDGRWGEPGEEDFYHEVGVGRACVDSQTETEDFVTKVIRYQDEPIVSESDEALMAGELLWSSPLTWGGTYKDEVKDGSSAHGYTTVGFPPSMNVDTLYDRDGTWSYSHLINLMENGLNIVNHIGHCNVTYCMKMDNSDISSFDNDGTVHSYNFVYTQGCYCGSFDNRTTGGGYIGDCFAEEFQTDDDGAVAVIMNSRYGWGDPGGTNGSSQYFDREFFDAMFAEQIYPLADANDDSKVDVIWAINYGANRWCYYQLNVFGDPAMHLWTAEPGNLDVSHVPVVFIGVEDMEITVTAAGGGPVAGSRVTIYTDDYSVYDTGLTDESGQVTLHPNASYPGLLHVKATAHDFLVSNTEAEIVPPSGPYLVIDEVLYIDDGGDGLVNAGESVDMRVKLRNVGIETATNVSAVISVEDEYITLVTDTQTYADIPPGGEAWSQGPYAFDVSPDCPDQRTVVMPTVIEGDERITWETQITFMVHAPTITILSILIDDTGSGNSNFRLDPGEDATVAITLLNSGSGSLDDITGIFTCDHPLITVSAGTGTIAGLGQGESGLLEPIFEVSVDLNFPAYEADFDLQVTGTNSYERIFEITLPIGGFYETVEEGAGDWVHYIVTAGFVDEWHISDTRNHTPGGSHSWKCGDTGSGLYANLLDAGLETPAVNLAGDAALLFWMWIDAEESAAHPGRAYDGGLVEMSVDGGAFEQITPAGGYTHTIREGSIPGPFPVDTPVFSGNFNWQPVRFDLPGMEGHVVFRFRFGSDGVDQKEGWYIDDIEILGLSSPEAVDGGDLGPVRLSLAPSRPNPFAGSTSISFAMPQAGQARLEVFDPSGRLVRTLLSAAVPAGSHVVVWEGADEAGRPVASGLYYYRLSTAESTMNRSIVLLR